jgi:hypothetical protein
MSEKSDITDQNTLEFAIFCIENVALKLGIRACDLYIQLSDGSDILDNYIIPEYDVLHTQSKDYIVDDIISLMKKRGELL